MADRRSNALDDDSFPDGLFPAGRSDRHATDAAGDVGSRDGDADLSLPGADELFPQLAAGPIDDNVDAAFDQEDPGGDLAQPIALPSAQQATAPPQPAAGAPALPVVPAP